MGNFASYGYVAGKFTLAPYFDVFGSTILMAAIGANIDMAPPENGSSADNSATDAARRAFTETFSEVADRTVAQNKGGVNQPGNPTSYLFNVQVDQEMVFPVSVVRSFGSGSVAD